MPTCPNCVADVPEERLEMHVAFCSRNVWRCTACGECMQRSAQEEHATQCLAAPVECECGEKIPRSALERHKQEACLMRTVECEFCEVSFTCVELMDHQEYCGSRTENCTRCFKLVKMRDLERHMASGCMLYGAVASGEPSLDSVASTTNGVATSLLSPLGASGSNAGRSSPGLFACPYCGSEQASFEDLQSHMAIAGCSQAVEQSRADGDARQAERPRGRHRQRQAPGRPDSNLAAALAGARGDPPVRHRRTARDWDAEMAEALAGRAARRGGGVAVGTGAAPGAVRAGRRNLLDISDDESSDDEDWQPLAAGAAHNRGSTDDADDDVSLSDFQSDSSLQRDTEDANLQMALQLSREEAGPASHSSMDEDLQLALAASRSEADEAARAQAALATSREQGARAARAQRGIEAGGQPPPGTEVLVLDSCDDSEEDEPPRKLAKRRRLKGR